METTACHTQSEIYFYLTIQQRRKQHFCHHFCQTNWNRKEQFTETLAVTFFRVLRDVFPVVCRAHADDNELPAGAVQPYVPAGRLCLPHDVLQRLHQRRLYPHAQNLPQTRGRKGYILP